MQTLYGKPAADGIAKGRIRVIEHSFKVKSAKALSADEEILRYHTALSAAGTELDNLKNHAAETVGENEASIFEIHKLMMYDDDFKEQVEGFIKSGGISAEEAVVRAGDYLAEQFAAMDTEYMRARAADVRSIQLRLTDILSSDSSGLCTGNNASYELNEPTIIASDDLTPAETICLDKTKVLGIITELGSASSHTAILARSMGIPAVVGINGTLSEYSGRECIIDGTDGIVYIEPTELISAKLDELMHSYEEKKRLTGAMRGVELMRNDRRIMICANAADKSDIESAAENDAEGIGLYRSEFLFMRYGRAPTEEEQFEEYRYAAEKMDGRECTIRTLDAGADKKIPYLNSKDEHNPALGMRAVRISLKKPELLYTQFRALYRAAAYGSISVLIPMIVLPSELEQVKDIAEKAKKSLEADGIPFGEIKLGIMIETPASAICADIFAGMVDFFSIGTNDLIQYVLAADRENSEVSYLAEPLPECVMRMIKLTCDAAANAGIPVGVCGELGEDERYIGFLLDCGVSKLSVSPPNVLKIRYAAKGYIENKNMVSYEITL